MYDISLGKISNKGDFTMHTLQTLIKNYLDYCKTKKNLNKKSPFQNKIITSRTKKTHKK